MILDCKNRGKSNLLGNSQPAIRSADGSDPPRNCRLSELGCATSFHPHSSREVSGGTYRKEDFVPDHQSIRFHANETSTSQDTMSICFGFLAALFGVGAFAFTNPAGVPVFGLAFAAAGFLRESRGSKRIAVFALLGAGACICAVGLLRSFQII
jgi:hypothetical protein